MRNIARICQFGSSFARASTAFGFAGAFKAKVAHRLYSRTAKRLHVTLKNSHRIVEFRCRGDIGVMTHFYSAGCLVVDTPTEPIQFILDGGANIGVETLRYSWAYPNARILAIEAEEANYELLKRNVTGLGNVQTLNAALFSSNTRVTLQSRGSGANSNESFYVSDCGRGPTYAVTIDSVLDSVGWSRIDVLKLDIEGAERALFSDRRARWLNAFRCLVMECPDRDSPYATQEIYAVLSAAGLRFRTYLFGENLILIRNDVGWTVEAFP